MDQLRKMGWRIPDQSHFLLILSTPLSLLRSLHRRTRATRQGQLFNPSSAQKFVKWCIKKFNKARNFDTLWRLQYSVSLQCDSLREKICGVSSRYLTVEDEEVNTTRFTLLAFKQEFSTFRVPLIHGSIKVSCKISQHKQKFQLTEKETLKKSTYIKETRNELRIHNFFFKFNC
jgi:hypothetical protein